MPWKVASVAILMLATLWSPRLPKSCECNKIGFSGRSEAVYHATVNLIDPWLVISSSKVIGDSLRFFSFVFFSTFRTAKHGTSRCHVRAHRFFFVMRAILPDPDGGRRPQFDSLTRHGYKCELRALKIFFRI